MGSQFFSIFLRLILYFLTGYVFENFTHFLPRWTPLRVSLLVCCCAWNTYAYFNYLYVLLCLLKTERSQSILIIHTIKASPHKYNHHSSFSINLYVLTVKSPWWIRLFHQLGHNFSSNKTFEMYMTESMFSKD